MLLTCAQYSIWLLRAGAAVTRTSRSTVGSGVAICNTSLEASAMLILPAGGRPDFSRPPVVTFAIILLNLIVFLFLQTGDNARLSQAVQYYAESPLPQLELPVFFEHLEKRGEHRLAESLRRNHAEGKYGRAIFELDHDAAFHKRLAARTVLAADHEDYHRWLAARQHYEKLREAVVSEHYSFRNAMPRWDTWFTHMFLHADRGHITGNLVVFFMVAHIVEYALGGTVFLLIYLLSGLGANLLSFLAAPDSTLFALGASGAISGAMAAFLVLYGLTRIRFFYWILIRAGFFMAPAMAILPVWIGWEAYRWLTSPPTINYAAHLGGFVTGALITLLARCWLKPQTRTLDQAPEVDPLAEQLSFVDAAIQRMDFDLALSRLGELARDYPQAPEVVSRYWLRAKTRPDSAHFKNAARALWNLQDPGGAHDESALEAWQHWLEHHRVPPRLDPATALSLARRLMLCGGYADAQALLRYAAAIKADPSAIADLLLTLLNRQLANGFGKEAGKVKEWLEAQYPETQAARLARQTP